MGPELMKTLDTRSIDIRMLELLNLV